MEHPDADVVIDGFNAAEQVRHPVAAVFHVLFKTLAIVWYLFGSLLFGGFVISFVIQILLLAFDFWTVKNITGRLLVGLRWWNDIKEDGSTEWRFEAKEDQSAIVPSEKRLFWMGLIIAPIVWIVFGIFAFFSVLSFQPMSVLPKLLTVAIALGLTVPNVYGYLKCSKDSADNIRGIAQSYIGGAALDAALRRVQ